MPAYHAKEYGVLIRVGGPNAGRTVLGAAGQYTYYHLPSGAKETKARSLLGPGMTVFVEGARHPGSLLASARTHPTGAQRCLHELDTSRYSVPWKLIGESVTFVAAERQVQLLYAGHEVACHAQTRAGA